MNDLRKRVEAEFDLTSAEPSWIEVFEVACSTLDTILQLEALVASDGLITVGSKQQTVVHPAVIELRRQREAYARLVSQLGIPDRPRSHHRRTP